MAEQELDGTVEVIVVNDGAPFEDSLLRKRRHRQRGGRPRGNDDQLEIRFIELNGGRGPAVARNVGIDEAAGTYIAFLDDDDLFLPGHLDAGVRALEGGEADFVYLGSIVSDRRIGEPPSSLKGFRLKAYPYDSRGLLVANFLHTGSVIVRSFRSTSVRFDESLEVCEDWDLWLALVIALQYRVTMIDRITSVYHQVAAIPGLVASAQRVAPSKFSRARTEIYRKWPCDDPLVQAHRDWMEALERYRDDLIGTGHRMPNLLFDAVLEYLFERMRNRQMPEYEDIPQFFESDGQTAR